MIAPIELRLDDHGIPFADERDDQSLAAEFAQVSGSARASQRVSMTASLKPSNVPDYVPHAGSCLRLVFGDMRPVGSSKVFSIQLRGRRIEFIEACRS